MAVPVEASLGEPSSAAAVYPVFLRLERRRVLLVGGGRVAAAKLPALRDAGAHVTVVAPVIRPELKLAGVALIERAFDPGDLDGASFVVAAAPPEVNRSVAAAAEARGLFVNAVDDAASASALLGGVVRRAGVTIAVSTGGRAPALAGLLREALEAVLPDDLAAWIQIGERARAGWKQRGLAMTERRPLLLGALQDLYAGKDGRLAASNRRPLLLEALQDLYAGKDGRLAASNRRPLLLEALQDLYAAKEAR